MQPRRHASRDWRPRGLLLCGSAGPDIDNATLGNGNADRKFNDHWPYVHVQYSVVRMSIYEYLSLDALCLSVRSDQHDSDTDRSNDNFLLVAVIVKPDPRAAR